MGNSSTYVVVSTRSWTRASFERARAKLPGQWVYISEAEEFSFEALERISPRYVFMPHWSRLVSKQIVDRFECVCFHMTDVPYGRGGSPLQNLIVRGHKDTQITALRMTEGLDEGPVYMKMPLSLAGTAQQIFERASDIIFDMVGTLVRTEPTPKPQTGAPTLFQRRTPDQSELPRECSQEQLYDFIRMVDAEGYPNAFLNWGEFKVFFTDAKLESGKVIARVSISKKESQ